MTDAAFRFASEPVGNKPASAIPGLSAAGAEKLRQADVSTASVVIGKWLVSGKDEVKFRQWLETIVDAKNEDLDAICQAVAKYVEAWI